MSDEGQNIVEFSRVEYLALKQENEYLKQELAQLKRLIFGKKNERFIPTDAGQSSLFEKSSTEQEPISEPQTITYTKEKKKDKKQPVRLALPAHLPREEEVIEPKDKQQDAVKIGEAVTEILEYTPGKVYVKRYVRPKYVQPSTSANHDKQVIVAELPSLPIPSGNAGPGLLAHLMISKFMDHLPFYRQVQMFKREGLKLSESTIGGWFKAVCKLLEPLYEEIQKQVLASEYINADETTVPVQSSNKQGATHTGYHWYYYSPKNKLVVVDYQPSRSAQGPGEFLREYKGVLQTDGYAGYEQFAKKPGITLLACMAHARRYFEKALDNDKKRAEHALREIQKLYAIERKAKEDKLNTDQLTELRQTQALPILNELHEWMKEQYGKVAPKSSIGKALAYSIKLWERLVGYTQSGERYIDNNLVENSIRPVALGRKNYLFAGSHDAAQCAAMMYSFLGCCKLNDVEPFQWLKETLEKIQETTTCQLHTLLPNFQQKS